MDIRTKKLRYLDPCSVLMDLIFYYQNSDPIPLNIRIFGADPDPISDRI